MEKLYKYLKLVKFSHTVFAMPFALIGFFLGTERGGGEFTWSLLGLIVLAMVFARNAAMGFNRWADREIDARNPRTAMREIPASEISPESAITFVVVNSFLFIVVAGFINSLALILAVPALIILLGYSYLKRFTALCHYGVGLALGIAPSAAYIAVTGTLSLPALLLSAIVFLWSGSFDILYALADEDFDKEHGLHSIPQSLGRWWSLAISAGGHALVLPLIVLLYFAGDFGFLYVVGASLFTSLLIYQHLIVKPSDISRLNAAFFTSNGVASAIFALFAITDLMLI
jgi:4-hydroxybenzoate polyprenyltransferase